MAKKFLIMKTLPEKKNGHRQKQGVLPKRGSRYVGVTGFSGLLHGVNGVENIENQAKHLVDTRLLIAQRYTIANQIGQQQGNMQLQRIIYVASGNVSRPKLMLSEKSRTAETKSVGITPLLPAIMERLPNWFKIETPGHPSPLSQNPALRSVLLILYARMGESLWMLIPKESITYVSEQGELDFTPEDSEKFRTELVNRGFTPNYYAKSRENLWGLREANISTAGLHFRGLSNGKVNAHIDLHPPSGTGIYHWLTDADHWFYKMRRKSHTPETLQEGVEKIGAYIPVLCEQKVHGDLTVKLHNLSGAAKGNPAAEAEIDEGKEELSEAGTILWSKTATSETELAEATWLLGLAAACASGASFKLAKKH